MYVSRVALHREAIAACTPFRLQICMALPFCFYPFRTHLAFQKIALSFSIHQGTFSKTRQRESENKLSLGRMYLPHPCIRASTARALLQHRTPSCGRLHRSERWRHGAAMPAGLHMVHSIKFVNICSVSSEHERRSWVWICGENCCRRASSAHQMAHRMALCDPSSTGEPRQTAWVGCASFGK